MALSLAELQGLFAKALHYQATGESCDVLSDAFTADERLQIYRNNFVIGLSEVMEATYPKVLALVGEECFQQLARRHVLTHPLTEGDVSGYGEGFADTIRQFDPVIATVPYLPDMADMEWKLDLSDMALSLAEEKPYRSLEELVSVTEEQQPSIVFHLASNIQLVSSQFAVFSLWEALEKEAFDGLDLGVAEQGVVWLDSARQLHIDSASDQVIQLIRSCSNGLSLSEIDPDLLAHLNTLMASGYLDGFHLKNDK
ncbi:DUF2063 domain-containing protein [Vibrio sp. S9_S30]|uniref:HvfC/BufC N-terminal domain-containing protein n=1 Tax=Vibrio sp. S9_S30 TaxID=2720226 RepID=UPI001680C6F0|nr:DNA-binding domain-containing protein [Vibrio sp. S9_S30]MBD1559635.1 DUF2063 domain-containing protein [Vibrio sp. S9_S30]